MVNVVLVSTPRTWTSILLESLLLPVQSMSSLGTLAPAPLEHSRCKGWGFQRKKGNKERPQRRIWVCDDFPLASGYKASLSSAEFAQLQVQIRARWGSGQELNLRILMYFGLLCHAQARLLFLHVVLRFSAMMSPW